MNEVCKTGNGREMLKCTVGKAVNHTLKWRRMTQDLNKLFISKSLNLLKISDDFFFLQCKSV